MSEKGLLQSILEAPDDDLPQQVYADWLEEHGDADRAEFIRLQCRIARLGEDDHERLPLRRREIELLNEHGPTWRKPLPSWARRLEWTFRRGFPAEVKLTSLQFLNNNVSALRKVTPLEGVELRDAYTRAKEIATCPHLSGLAVLRLKGRWLWWANEGPGVGSADLRRLGASQHLDALRTLEVEDSPLGAAGVKALAGGPAFARLTTLRLKTCNLKAGALTALGKAPFFPRLEHLDLTSNWFHARGAVALAGWTAAERLTTLCLACTGAAGGDGADALADAAFLPQLHRLDMSSDHYLSGRALARLLAPGRLTALRELNLDACEVSGEGVAALAIASCLSGLTSLVLSNNELTDEDVIALSMAPGFRNLRSLDLWANHFGDRAVQALVGSKRLPALKELTLAENAITDAGARMIADSPLADRLDRLGFWKTGITNKGTKLLKERFGDRLVLG